MVGAWCVEREGWVEGKTGSCPYLVDQLAGRERRELLERVSDEASEGRAEMRAVFKGLALLLVDNGVNDPELLQLVGINLGREGGKEGGKRGYRHAV